MLGMIGDVGMTRRLITRRGRLHSFFCIRYYCRDYSNLPGVHPVCQGWNKVLQPGCLTAKGPTRLRLNDVQAVRTAATPVVWASAPRLVAQ